MKKFFILLTTLLFTAVSAIAADVSRLYRVKNASADEVKKVLTPYLKRLYPNTAVSGNSYILEDKNKNHFYVVIISEKDNNCYFYYMSNNEDEDLRKNILKSLKNNDFKPKKVFDSSLKSYFYGEAYTNLAHSNVKINMRAKQGEILPETQTSAQVDAKNINYDFSD